MDSLRVVLKLVVSVGVSFLAGAIGSLATIANIPTWYAALHKPFFNPPNWLFGPVWTLLYILMGISLFIMWSASVKRSRATAWMAFFAQLVLNTLWSLVFFGAHQPWLGVGVIVLLLVAIGWTMREFWRFNRAATYILIPYLVWVSFATCLNVAVALLN